MAAREKQINQEKQTSKKTSDYGSNRDSPLRRIRSLQPSQIYVLEYEELKMPQKFRKIKVHRTIRTVADD
ncbi:unnamed protein product [Dovyalis caffra]|uniref:Uncharacterized protein n=1 Tax=Dovyalis caffra TaxID=77055 RepID=A0AAV1S1J6_9ROSI|nr:unnamed protein product [Dovyalis caffra]